MVLFGGADINKSYNDTWEWKESRWTQIADSGPSPRSGHTIVYDSSTNKVVLFGGSYEPVGANLQYLNDTWVLE